MSAAPETIFGAMLVAGLFGVAICLGAASLVAFCSLTGASWWTSIRRVPMSVALLLPVPLAVTAVALFAGVYELFPWADPEHVAASPILQAKSAWLDPAFFLARAAIVMAIWILMVGALRRAFVQVVERPGPASSRRLERASAIFFVLLAPTLSVAAWDWAMSLEPEWFSTMYGVYLFSGAALSGLALVSIFVTTRWAEPILGARVDRDVLHNLGQLLFGFASLWAYIWFCQYMLIWYANLPEEATYYAARMDMRWATLFWIVPVLSFVVPFVVLMPVAGKRSRAVMMQVSTAVLIGRWMDTYLMVWPPLDVPAGIPWVAFGIGIALLLAMVWVWPRAYAATGGGVGNVGATPAPRWASTESS